MHYTFIYQAFIFSYDAIGFRIGVNKNSLKGLVHERLYNNTNMFSCFRAWDSPDLLWQDNSRACGQEERPCSPSHNQVWAPASPNLLQPTIKPTIPSVRYERTAYKFI